MLHPQESQRLSALYALDLDYTDLDNTFKDLTLLAAKISGTEISLVSFIDTYTQWVVSRFGLETYQNPIEGTVCQYTLLEKEHLEIPDLSKDIRFVDQPFIHDPLSLKYYLGIPLKSANGYPIGSLCVLDKQQHKLSDEKIELLKIIANEIILRIQDRHRLQQLRQELHLQTESCRKVAHDIRGPLGGIIGLAKLLTEESPDLKKEDWQEMVDMIGKSGQSVMELAEEILKNVSPQKELTSETFNLRLWKEKLEKLYHPQALHKQITFKVDIKGLGEETSIPKKNLLQISGNLLSNAIKFTPSKGSVTVQMQLLKEGNQHLLMLEVEDTGKGMSLEMLENLRQGHLESSLGSDGEKGYGLGLSSVKKMIAELGGTFHFYPSPQKGMVFQAEIPIH